MSPRIAVVGSINIDVVVRSRGLPRPGETLVGESFLLCCGGKGANQAVMAARLGARVAMVGVVGHDLFGEHALRNLAMEGIDARHVRRDGGAATGMAAILVDEQGENRIIILPGANHRLTAADVESAADDIRAARLLLCQLEVPVAATHAALRLARAVGATTILNPAPASSLTDDLLALVDLCIPNETELASLTGLSDAEAGARALLRRGPSLVIVTLGDQGALIVDSRRSEHVPAVAVEVVDTSGAGDAFIGSLAVFLGEGAPLAEAVRRANAVAALTVTRPGTQAAFPQRAALGL
ncbi:MAG: ribokinase [Gemmataceae bacterium]|nr:ribokinase [Gemmataceae bacterium]MDW8264287.1 ribokinase [Gemmataceae bacterium]